MTAKKRRAHNFKDLTGQKFGRWSVIELGKVEETSKGKRRVLWLCRCDCGVERLVFTGSLTYGTSVSCGCYRDELAYTRDYKKLPDGESTFRQIYKHYIYQAGLKNRDWEIDIDSFRNLTQSNCQYCGISPQSSMRINRKSSNYVYNGLDRVDNSKGYTLDNVVPCCKNCNLAKKNMTTDAFLEWATRIYKYQESLHASNCN